MKTIRFGFALLLIGSMTMVNGQVISSQKSYLKIKQEPEPVKLVTPEPVKLDTKNRDSSKPAIKLVSHTLGQDNIIETSEKEAVIIGRVSDDGEISSLMVNSKLTDVSAGGIFNTTLKLSPGENDVVILALDSNDNLETLKFKINYAPIKKTLAETVNKESVYYALIIGINNYSDPAITSLDNPITDAEALYNVLTTKYTFDKKNIQFLKDAKRDDIIYSLDHLARNVTENDNLLIFYAGHGQFDENSNIGYWLPSDARRITKADWFRNSTLVDYLKEIESKHTLLITDACFGGSIFKTRSAFADTPKAIELLYGLPSRKAMTSGTLSEVPDKSSFAKFLVERLNTNTEQYLSSEQLFSNLRIAVINNSDAVPQYGEIKNVGDQGGDFIFIKK